LTSAWKNYDFNLYTIIAFKHDMGSNLKRT